MTNYKITLRGNDTLYSRKLVSPAIPAQEAVAFQPAIFSIANPVAAVPAKDATPFIPAVWTYTPFSVTFNTETDSSPESGSEVFSEWLDDEGKTELSDTFNIEVEKEVETYVAHFNLRHSAIIDADSVEEHNIENEDEADSFVRDSYHMLDYEDDGEVTDIEIEVDDTTFTDMEW